MIPTVSAELNAAPPHSTPDSIRQIETILDWVDRNSSKLLEGCYYGNPTCRRILMNAARLRPMVARQRVTQPVTPYFD